MDDHRPGEEYLGRDFRTGRREDFDALGRILLAQIGDHGELRHEEVRRTALELRARDPRYRRMSDDGAYAVHSYTRHEVFPALNTALRTGFGLPALVEQVRAIVSGLNELPPFEGEVVRTVDHRGDRGRAAATAAHYEPGTTVVESQFSSTSPVGDGTVRGDVELRIQAKTGRDISGIASVADEREVLLKPGTQLHVLGKEPVTLPDGREKWVIRAEEVLPGDPRYLGREAADQHVQERRARQAADDRAPVRSITSALGQPEDEDAEAEHRRTHEPDGGWAELNRTTTPPGVPAIHAGTAQSAEQQVRFLREHLPEVANVNAHNYYAPGARENGFHGNDADAVVALEDGFRGEPREASPALAEEVTSLDEVRRKLGGRWAEHPDFASAIGEIGGQPVGSRGVLAFQAAAGEPNRIVTIVHTGHGVAIVDPMTNRLASLPAGHAKVQLLPYHREGGQDQAPHPEPVRDQVVESAAEQDVIHAYLAHDLAYDLNAAHRSGAPEGVRAHQARALAAALDDVPGTVARTVRGIDHHGDGRLAELTADEYSPGRVTVETSFSSATITDDEAPMAGYDVEIHVDSKNVKDVGERVSLSKPGTQLFVHHKELVERRWVVHAEEVLPGDPRHLDPGTAEQRMAERRARYAEIAHQYAESGSTRLAELLGPGGGNAEPPAGVEPGEPEDLGPAPAPDPVAHHDALPDEPTLRHDDEDLGPAPGEEGTGN